MNDVIPAARPLIDDEERAAVDRVMRSGMIAQGPEVAAFEQEFSAHFALGRACVAVNSGTLGLHLGPRSADVKAGDDAVVVQTEHADYRTLKATDLPGATTMVDGRRALDACLLPGARIVTIGKAQPA